MTKSELIDAIVKAFDVLKGHDCTEDPTWTCSGDRCFPCLIEHCKRTMLRIAGGQPNPTPWTPIEEEMPEDYQLVLLSVVPTEENTDGTGFVMIDRIIRGDYEEGWKDFWELDERLWRVNAWMPLPKPYEVSE